IQNVRLFTEVQERNHALTESLEQQTATADILKVISSSPTDVKPVFDTIVESAVRLCDGLYSAAIRLDGDQLHLVGQYNWSGEGLAMARRLFPMPLSRDHVTARAVREARTIHLQRMQDDATVAASSRNLAIAQGYQTLLVVPMLRESQAIGAVVVARVEGPFSDGQVALLQTFADQAAIAIENVRLLTEVQERNRALTESLEQQTATGDILKAISGSPTDTQPVFDMITRNARRLCGADSCAVFTYDGQLVHLQALDNMGYAGADALRQSYPAPVSPGHATGRAILQGRPIQIEDAQLDTNFVFTALLEAGMRTILAVPMMQDGAAVGVIVLHMWTTARPFSESQIALLQTFADQAVIAIQNVRLFTELGSRNADLTAALEQQTATADVLRVMSASTTDAEPVFDAIVRNAARLCHARFALAYQLVGDVIHFVSQHNLPSAAAQFQQTFPQRLSESGTLIARAILRGEVINVPDILADTNVAESVRELARSSGYRSVIAVPIMRAGRALGALAITRSDPREDLRPFSDDEIPILQTFTEQAGIAIEKVRLFNELEARTAQLTRSVGELRALGEVSQAVGSTLDLDAVLETIVGRAVQLSGSDQGVIYEFDDAGQTFYQRATHGMTAEYLQVMEAAPIRVGEGAIGRAAITRQPVEVVDMQKDSQLLAAQVREQLIRQDMGSLLALPLVREERILGGLVIIRRQRGAFSPDVVAILKTFAAQSVLAI